MNRFRWWWQPAERPLSRDALALAIRLMELGALTGADQQVLRVLTDALATPSPPLVPLPMLQGDRLRSAFEALLMRWRAEVIWVLTPEGKKVVVSARLDELLACVQEATPDPIAYLKTGSPRCEGAQ